MHLIVVSPCVLLTCAWWLWPHYHHSSSCRTLTTTVPLIWYRSIGIIINFNSLWSVDAALVIICLSPYLLQAINWMCQVIYEVLRYTCNWNSVICGTFMHEIELNSLKCHIDGLVQEGRNSIANALESRLSCTNHRYVQDLQASMSKLTPKSLINILSGCPTVREKSGKFQTWQKSGNFVEGQGKNEYWESQGICI